MARTLLSLLSRTLTPSVMGMLRFDTISWTSQASVGP